jgi:hypothetical protein
MLAPCPDIASIDVIKHPTVHVFASCVRTGDSWVRLRTYQTCGARLCCNSSPNRHATKHALAKRAIPSSLQTSRESDG